MKTLAIFAGFVGAFALTSTAAFAGPYNDRYNELHSKPAESAQCGTQAESGGFGYWGPDFNRGIQNPAQHPDRGAGTDHGFNNAVICGNPPEDAPPA
jgi:hypothetical protein